jgi:hypothetical protein
MCHQWWWWWQQLKAYQAPFPPHLTNFLSAPVVFLINTSKIFMKAASVNIALKCFSSNR